MTSYTENIIQILDIVQKENPKTILDIGSGFGKYGILCREALLSQRTDKEKDYSPKDDLIIDCVESAKYFHSLRSHEGIYNNHYHIKVNNFIPDKNYDLALMIDVVEHEDKKVMQEIIARLKTCCKKILISTPKLVVFYTEEYYGKDCPTHISQWNKEDFNGEDYSTDKSWIYLI